MRAKNLTKVRGICHDALEADRDGTYLYEKLVEAAHKELGKNLYDPEYYWLQYQMPDAPFTINVEVDDPTAVLRAYKEFATLEKQPELKKRIIRRIIPRALLKEYGNAPVFGKSLSSRGPARCALSRSRVPSFRFSSLARARRRAPGQEGQNAPENEAAHDEIPRRTLPRQLEEHAQREVRQAEGGKAD